MDRNLALEFVRVTEAAAIAASKWIGKGEAKKADGAAVDEMRDRFNQIDFAGRVVIGEGQKDEAPELYTGEKVGTGKGPAVDLAVDPLECTDSVAYGRYNAIAAIAAGARGSLLGAPDTYMEKLAAGPKAAKVIKMGAPVRTNIIKTAKALGKKVSDITVCVMDRDRHRDLINQIRKTSLKLATFKPSKIYSSKERRALESAKILSDALKLSFEEIDGMQERNWGVFTGKPWEEVKKVLDPMTLDERYNYTPQNGEAWKTFETRLIQAIKKITKDNTGKTIICKIKNR